jgi:hypothetical protein
MPRLRRVKLKLGQHQHIVGIVFVHDGQLARGARIAPLGKDGTDRPLSWREGRGRIKGLPSTTRAKTLLIAPIVRRECVA